jgi:class 3 adenylate cyclase/tetratricopeptide (TPR) repeat protein
VTVVFCDVTGSTALGDRLDPESLSKVMGRYFEVMRSAVERHGGTVEKFIGDAVLAVFGVPKLHEDDALRAVRAAEAMRDALVGLNEELQIERGVSIQTRIGVNTGEVLVESRSATEGLVTGDAVNVAARLEQAAKPGEILLGWQTFRLARDAIEVETVEPLELKGKSEPVPAFRLIRVIPGAEGHARRMDSEMVGRDGELQLLTHAFDRSIQEQACVLFTLLGSAGVGKSRMSEEFLSGIGDARVLRGRCLHYGEGITYWPVVEVLTQAAGIQESDSAEEARGKLDAVLVGTADAETIATRITNLLGLGGAAVADETFWAIRKLLERLAASEPLVVIFDDIQWAEPTLLDLIEHVSDWSRDAPILLLCMARPDLLDGRPGWGGGKMNSTTILLEPLPAAAGELLLTNLLGSTDLESGARARILAAAGGNPLFVEEMLDMLVDQGHLTRGDGGLVATSDLATIDVPPTISALLTARLDRLPTPERTVLEHGSVEGQVFHRGGVTALQVEPNTDHAIGHQLMDLVRKELIRPDRAEIPGDDAFRFRHLLIRDAAYQAMPKEVRADLHERFAGWMQTIRRIAEVDEIVGYHLEQAHTYLMELGPADDRTDSLAEAAADHLIAAARNARERGDDPAAANLLSRAASLLPRGEPKQVNVLCDLAKTVAWVSDNERAEALARELLALLEMLENPALKARVSIALAWATEVNDPHWLNLWLETAESAIDVLGNVGDELGLAQAYDLLGWVENGRSRFGASTAAREQAYEHAKRSGDRIAERDFLMDRTAGTNWGPMPASEGLALCRQVLELAGDDRVVRGDVLVKTAVFLAMGGRFDEAGRLYEQSISILRDLGRVVPLCFAAQSGYLIGWLSGDLRMAELEMRWSCELLLEHGVKDIYIVNRDQMALAICAQGRPDEAEPLGVLTRDEVADHPEDVLAQWNWRRILGNVAAARGKLEEAERLLQEAVGIGEQTDAYFDRSCTNMDLADVLRRAGRSVEAIPLVEEAIRLSELHEDIATAAKARERFAALT